MISGRVCCAVMLCCVVSGTLWGSTSQAQSAKGRVDAERLDAILDTPTGDSQFEQLFKLVRDSREPMSERIRCQNNSIAIRIAWNSIASRKAEVNSDSQVVPGASTLLRMAEFLSDFRDRAHVSCPQWWPQSLAYESGDRSAFSRSVTNETSGGVQYTLRWAGNEENPNVYCTGPAPTTLVERNGAYVLIQGEHQIPLSANVIDALGVIPSKSTHYSAMLFVAPTTGVCFISCHFPHSPEHMRVVAVREQDGSLQWKAEAWGTGSATYIGRAQQRAELVVSDGQVALFATSTFGTSCDVFDAGTGKVRCRFSTKPYTHRSGGE
jgi:hypothetical protein